jgi:hypothetical protein
MRRNDDQRALQHGRVRDFRQDFASIYVQ